MTATATLTDRYVDATIRSLPAAAQADVRAELEASIADAVQARVDQGEPREVAERAVLSELGDPGILAAGYADRPLHLIGPRYFLVWWRLLKLLLWIVPACAAVGIAIAKVLEFATIGETIGAIVVVILQVIVNLGFWTTLVFAVLERTVPVPVTAWSVDQLPEVVENRAGLSEMIGSIIFLVLGAAAILWDSLRGFLRPDGEALPLLNPELWPWWITALFVVMAAELILAVAVYRAGRWSVPLATVNTVLALAFGVPALYLLVSGQLVNPEFLHFLATEHAEDLAKANAGAAAQGGIFRVVTVVFAVVTAGIVVWDIIDGWWKTFRARTR
ncbi:permease prefix domain 1-containing protein [Microbacterium sp. 179-I 3D3 NHS]|uniref:permease prefix domain 1-containing protein n=1 Tax=Microbacterium sp. 179-I 3D3 NHS TaxID=3142382 RepID=UPI0039A01832